MNLKKDIVFRKAKKEDYPSIMEFIRENYKKRLECEYETTEKLLSKLLFYQFASHIDYFQVAIYREQVVGVLMAGVKKKFSSVYKIKKLYPFCRLKITKDGRWNLDILNQMSVIRNNLDKQEGENESSIVFLFVRKNDRRNGIGTELLNQLTKVKNSSICVYMDQEDNAGFMENYGFSKMTSSWKMMEGHKRRFRETISLYCDKKTEFENDREAENHGK